MTTTQENVEDEGKRVMDQLEFKERFSWKNMENTVAVIYCLVSTELSSPVRSGPVF